MSSSTFRLDEPVFVIDDEEELLELTRQWVERAGYRAVIFNRAKQALEHLRSEKPFLILSDLRMPEMDGLELCAEIRKTHPTLPFCLLTAFAEKNVAVAGLGRGVSDLLEKPVQPEQLEALIRRFGDQRARALEDERRETEEITALFIEESTDLLSDLDELVLRLEEDPIDPVVIDCAFRKIHSVKGGAGAVPGGKHLAALSHAFESVLSSIKKRELKPEAGHINLFLTCADLSNQLIRILKSGNPPQPEFIAEMEAAISKLNAIKDRGASPGAVEQSPASVASGPSASSAASPSASPARVQESGQEEEGVFVPNEKLDSFMSLSGELIVLKNYFQMLGKEGEAREDLERHEKRLGEFAYSLNKLTDRLQNEIISIRKVSLERVFGKLPRVIRQTAQDLRKKVRLQTNGLELGVDKNIASALSASLVHMVRNSVDHGIERPEVRVAAGKPADGTITLSAAESQGIIQLTVSDDGAGINRERVIAKAIQNGLITQERAVTLTDTEVFDLIFLPGFSTAETVSDVSGRGVGMDVVKSAVLAHNGKIRIESQLGKGTTFFLEIPVPKTVMIEQALLSSCDEITFAVPLGAISRITSCDQLIISEVDGKRTCQFEGRTVLMRTYSEYLDDRNRVAEDAIREKTAIFLHHKGQQFALVVDKIQDQLEAVIRPFDPIVGALPGLKGTTVLDNEGIAYIVSPEEMFGLQSGQRKPRPATDPSTGKEAA